MNRTVNIAIIAALTLGAAAVAAAMSSTSRAPRAADVPIVVTDRVVTSTPAAGRAPTGSSAGARTMTGTVPPPVARAKPSDSDKRPATREPDGQRGSSNGQSSGSVDDRASDDRESDDGRDDDVEVVKPPVHEEDEPSDSYNPEEEQSDSD